MHSELLTAVPTCSELIRTKNTSTVQPAYNEHTGKQKKVRYICFSVYYLNMKYKYTDGNGKQRIVRYSRDFVKIGFTITGLYCAPIIRV